MAEDQAPKIVITLEKTGEGQWNSFHQVEGVDLLTAAWILIDLGREILVSLLQQTHQHEEVTNGH